VELRMTLESAMPGNEKTNQALLPVRQKISVRHVAPCPPRRAALKERV